MRRLGLTLLFVALAAAARADVDLSEYRTVDTARTAKAVKGAALPASAAPGYLGVAVAVNADGRLAVADVEPDSPAAKAKIQSGDIVLSLDGETVPSADAFRSRLQAKAPGAAVKVSVTRQGKPLDLMATLAATSRPMKPSGQRATLGVTPGEPRDGESGTVVGDVATGSPAEAAGIKKGDLLLDLDMTPLLGRRALNDALSEKQPGDSVAVTFRRDGKTQTVTVKLTAERERQGGRFGAGGWDDRLPSYWRKDVYRLAVVCVEYPDVKHNPKIARADWEQALFSSKTYVNKKSATGQDVHGSLNDYYQELSCGVFRVEGKVFDWIEMSKKRADYASGTGTSNAGKQAFLAEAIDKLTAREGKDALKEFDGLFFMYAGETVRTTRGSLYWPHRATVTHGGRRWPYFIVPEGGARMGNISVIGHEFGHMLGLPDLYARPENPGSEGLGNWCAMSNQLPNGRPQHFGPWCKEQLGWLKPTTIDPTEKQKLVLSPIEGSPKECFKVLVRPDGSEYFLLENRKKKGFDRDLPAEGLLVWRVVGNRPILEESHGVDGPTGPRMFTGAVPFPSPANNAFTPWTTPSSRSQLGGGLPVYITNVRRVADGRVTFQIGYEYQ